jgi:DNA-binding transcriptional MerR regulator
MMIAVEAIAPQSGANVHLIGELRDKVGMDPETVRYYEREGLLKPKRVGHIRIYETREIERLKLIKLLRQVDIGVERIRQLVEQHGEIRLDNLPGEAKSEIGNRLRERKAEIERLEQLVSKHIAVPMI